MRRPVRALPWTALLIPVLLTGCGTETEPADAAELASRARTLGIAPEHVYATEADGFTLAQQSVGVYGGDGFHAVYVAPEGGAQIQLTVDRGTVTAADCPDCVRDGDAWYRGIGEQREYAVPKDGHVVRVTGTMGVSRDVLREAALTAHRPSADELDTLLPSAAPGPTAPVERGDLPPEGDGAPNNEVGTGG
ncbi:hypothetical protein I2W78_07255 [Streptomyces spinoverrucosus]|uniref:hypothetical protein n=1 Tax=Streptomyces spinoverrucosus TaxID=284043 RepID=UPI0018C36311|nr:hypothetical protein [Streptomyces spinoverrucosus]MBG0851643.1 hypothetical protein [Streptomyces spinoverrucosus]